MSSSLSHSASTPDEREFLAFARPFTEESRRAQILTLVNWARTDREVAYATVQQLCEALEAEVAFVAATNRHSGELEVVGEMGLSVGGGASLAHDALCRSALGAARAEAHQGEDLLGAGARHLVLSPWRGHGGRQVLVGIARLYDEGFDGAETALVEAVTESVGHAIERAWLGLERDRHAARQAALARAATTLSASLIPEEVLETLSSQVGSAFEPDVVAVYRVCEGGVLKLAASEGMSSGMRAKGAEALSCEAARSGEAAVRQPSGGGRGYEDGSAALLSGVAAPVRVHGSVEAVVMIGYRTEHRIEAEDVGLLTAFADLAQIAWRNAADHAAVRRAAELDSLTGCLNHGAFQSRLREEVSRAERTGQGCALVLVDLNEFKAVNDTFGHLAGDALLRRVAEGLRASVRPYDHVGRYGGDEFAVLLPATEEDVARRLTDRVIHVISAVELAGGARASASAGIAGWRPGDTADAMIERADSAMLDVKRTRRRLPDGYVTEEHAVPGSRERQRVRRLATAARIGARLARLLDEREIVEAAIVDLAASLGYENSVVVRGEPDGLALAAIGRPENHPHDDPASTETLRAAADAMRERRTELVSTSTLAVPVYVAGDVWGAIAISSKPGWPMGDADAELVQRVADHLGAALQTARVYDELEQTHAGTAAALAAALEAKDSYTGNHARSIADLAVLVAAELGLDDARQRAVRYGALFHDIGKIAVPDAILNKPGALTEPELAVVRTHPEVGEQILSSVPFLADVREIVRHDHERWDGEGYPDRLCGEEIPIGARIVLVVDAYHAMRSDRPYRRRMRTSTARAELLRHAGSQFDPAVVRALLTVLEREPEVELELA